MHPVRKREMGDTTLSYAVGNKGTEFSLAGLPSPHREHLLNKGPATPSAGLPSPSSLRDATSPKVRGLGSPPSFRFILYALLPQEEPSGVTPRLHAFAKGSHFGGAGAKRLRGRARQRRRRA